MEDRRRMKTDRVPTKNMLGAQKLALRGQKIPVWQLGRHSLDELNTNYLIRQVWPTEYKLIQQIRKELKIHENQQD